MRVLPKHLDFYKNPPLTVNDMKDGEMRMDENGLYARIGNQVLMFAWGVAGEWEDYTDNTYWVDSTNQLQWGGAYWTMYPTTPPAVMEPIGNWADGYRPAILRLGHWGEFYPSVTVKDTQSNVIGYSAASYNGDPIYLTFQGYDIGSVEIGASSSSFTLDSIEFITENEIEMYIDIPASDIGTASKAGSDWDTVHDSTTSDTWTDSDPQTAFFGVTYNGVDTYTIYRAFAQFRINIPEEMIIVGAQMFIHGNTNFQSVPIIQDSTFQVGSESLSFSDFGTVIGKQSTPQWTGTGWNALTLTEEAIAAMSAIQEDGDTPGGFKVCIRSYQYDYVDTAPTGTTNILSGANAEGAGVNLAYLRVYVNPKIMWINQTQAKGGIVEMTSEATWALARDAATGENVTAFGGPPYDGHQVTTGFNCHRMFLEFDLSSIPSGANIMNVALRFGDVNNVNTVAVQLADYGISLGTDDFQSFSGPLLSDDTEDKDNDNGIYYTFNSAGIAAVKNAISAGKIQLCVRDYDFDYLNVEPDGSYSASLGIGADDFQLTILYYD